MFAQKSVRSIFPKLCEYRRAQCVYELKRNAETLATPWMRISTVLSNRISYQSKWIKRHPFTISVALSVYHKTVVAVAARIPHTQHSTHDKTIGKCSRIHSCQSETPPITMMIIPSNSDDNGNEMPKWMEKTTMEKQRNKNATKSDRPADRRKSPTLWAFAANRTKKKKEKTLRMGDIRNAKTR